MRKVYVADLFCGAGGTSTGLTQACESRGQAVELVAVNHWDRAIETHSANHPKANHFCESLTALNPLRAVPGGHLHLLVASPECTHHSRARGGKPVEEQSRSSAWCIVRWATELRINHILIENVPEFESWGPVSGDGKPLKSKRGQYFLAFVATLRGLGYVVDWRVLNAADYGDPTTRERLFIQAAKKGLSRIHWPEPSHAKRVDRGGLIADTRKPWRAAKEIIDWSILGKSIFDREKPLAEKTLARIAGGLEKFGGEKAEPFLVILRKGKSSQSLNEPLPTITTSGAHHMLIEPFLTAFHSGSDSERRNHPLNAPLPTLDTSNRFGLVEPFLIPYYGNSEPTATTLPLPTITTKDRFALVEPLSGLKLDIRLRMLQPGELAAGMSFPPGYKLTGSKQEQVKQIGNAVPVGLSRALCSAVLEGKR